LRMKELCDEIKDQKRLPVANGSGGVVRFCGWNRL
jgi:hypothetical protein